MTERDITNIFLVGMPGSGKTTVGKTLAKRLGLRFVDADKEVVVRTGVPIATIFEIEGEAGFRVREAQTIADLVLEKNILLATGGGVVLNADSRTLLRQHGTVVYLRAGVAQLRERTRRDTKRPLLQGDDPEAVLTRLLTTREPLYTQTAHVIVDASRDNVSKLVQQIIEAVNASSLLDLKNRREK